LNQVFLAGNHFHQDFSDRIKFGGVDERVGADVAKCYELCQVEKAVENWQVFIQHYKQKIEIARQKGDGEEYAYNNHGLDHVGLNLI